MHRGMQCKTGCLSSPRRRRLPSEINKSLPVAIRSQRAKNLFALEIANYRVKKHSPPASGWSSWSGLLVNFCISSSSALAVSTRFTWNLVRLSILSSSSSQEALRPSAAEFRPSVIPAAALRRQTDTCSCVLHQVRQPTAALLSHAPANPLWRARRAAKIYPLPLVAPAPDDGATDCSSPQEAPTLRLLLGPSATGADQRYSGINLFFGSDSDIVVVVWALIEGAEGTTQNLYSRRQPVFFLLYMCFKTYITLTLCVIN